MTIRVTSNSSNCSNYYKTTSKSTIKGYKYERERIYSPNSARLVTPNFAHIWPSGDDDCNNDDDGNGCFYDDDDGDDGAEDGDHGDGD